MQVAYRGQAIVCGGRKKQNQEMTSLTSIAYWIPLSGHLYRSIKGAHDMVTVAYNNSTQKLKLPELGYVQMMNFLIFSKSSNFQHYSISSLYLGCTH
jgi:hypothetical protein